MMPSLPAKEGFVTLYAARLGSSNPDRYSDCSHPLFSPFVEDEMLPRMTTYHTILEILDVDAQPYTLDCG